MADDTPEDAYNSVLDFAKSARVKASEKINTMSNAFNNPKGALIDYITSSNNKDEDEDSNFDLWNIAKWVGGLVIGKWMLGKIFGGGDDDNKDNDNSSSTGFGTTLKVGLLALTSWMAWANREKIMDMVSSDDADFMHPETFEPG